MRQNNERKPFRIAMAQMSMSRNLWDNVEKSLSFMEQAKEKEADLIFFPEIQLSPFFPQFEKQDATKHLIELTHPAIEKIKQKCRELKLYASPNIYLSENGKPYDASLFINPEGEIEGISKMVNIAQAEKFYEQDYYTPSDTGFRVYDTPYGKIGIVICYDRHIPGSIPVCAKQGADLILIPTANTLAEPMELFEWEIRVQAMQNKVYIAMCNRVGKESDMEFAGESIVADPAGGKVIKAGPKEELILVDILAPL